MGKSKAKKAQRYSTPSDKYLIVTDPWGGVPVQEPNFFNNVTAWFEIMLKATYPGVRPSAIYYQWTNKNIVVELPDHIDLELFLGAHYWKDFLVPPHCFNVAERASYVYEFDYKNHHIPPVQGGWTPGYAAYSKIRPDFDVRDPYPPSRPTRNSSLAFAKRLPPAKLLLPGQEDLPPLPPLPLELSELPLPLLSGLEEVEAEVEGILQGVLSEIGGDRGSSAMDGMNDERDYSAARNKTCVITRFSPSPTLTTRTTTTRDPRRSPTMKASDSTTSLCPDDSSYHPPGYSVDADAFLTSVIPSLSSESSGSASTLKMGKKMDPYEEEDHAMEFLRHTSAIHTSTATTVAASLPATKRASVKAEVKQEPLDYDHPISDLNVGYTPSAELQAAFASLNQLGYEAEPQVKEESESDRYAPSEDLLCALASLPRGMVDLSSTTASPVIAGDRGRADVSVKDEPRDDDDNVGYLRSAERMRIKREPESPDSGTLTKRVKLER